MSLEASLPSQWIHCPRFFEGKAVEPTRVSHAIVRSSYQSLHVCNRCQGSFIRKSDLLRHQNQRKTPCDGFTSFPMPQDEYGHRRRLTRTEILERKRMRNCYYYKLAKRRKALATKPEDKRLRQGTEPKRERERRISTMEWRRVIRSAGRRAKEEIDELAKALAHEYRVGDPNPPALIRCLYDDMSWIFRDYPKYWDSNLNKWKTRWFRHEESDGEVCSDLQLVYKARDRMDEESDNEDGDSQF